MAAPMDHILEDLKDVKPKSGGGWMACCPVHHDRKPSLSIDQEHNGTILLHCFAGCETEAIVAKLGLELSDLYPPTVRSITAQRFPKDLTPIPCIVQTYDYCDEAGVLLFQVVRYEPKGFKQRRPAGNGSWAWNRNGVRSVLYNMHLLTQALPDQPVFVVEGEKDADRLTELSFLATTCPGGAGRWRDAYSERLRGRDVVIIPDNDAAGRRHAEQVALSLNGAATSIKIIELPDVPDKGDVSDWLDATGDNPDALMALVSATTTWSAPEPNNTSDGGTTPSPQGARTDASAALSATFPALTDLGNAARLVAAHGERLRFCHHFGKWFVWDGRRWAEDQTGQVMRLAKDAARAIFAEAATTDDEVLQKKVSSWAIRSQAAERLKAMVELAKSEPGIPVTPDELDRNLWLLNVANGTIDLRTGRLRPPDPADLNTKLAPVAFEPNATCPVWLGFIDTIMAGNTEMIGFLQRGIGYALTGDTSERCLFVGHGAEGRNGKTTLLRTVAALLGDYALRTPVETLLVRPQGGIPNDIARLKGARFVYGSESEDGRRLAEALVKDLTGQDIIAARFLHREFFDFTPICKIWLMTNHRPLIRGTDHAIWDRIRLIPFAVRIPEEQVDRRLGEKLRAELPGVLAWAVEGCLEWQAKGLAAPKTVAEATAGYRSEMDIVAAWIADACVIGKGLKATAKELHASYDTWCEEAGEKSQSQKMLAIRLQEKGFLNDTGPGGYRVWKGLGLKVAPVEGR